MKHQRRTVTVSVAMVAAASVFTVNHQHVNAMTANPIPYTVDNGGQSVEIQMQGTPWVHWEEDAKGYAVELDTVTGQYQYVQSDSLSSMSLENKYRAPASGLVVGQVDPDAVADRIESGANFAFAKARAVSQGFESQGFNNGARRLRASPHAHIGSERGRRLEVTTGTLNNLVVLVRWKDHATNKLPTAADFNTFFNKVGGDPTIAPTGSLKDYYKENSYGKLNIQSTIVPWFTVSLTQAEAAAGCSATCGDKKFHEALTEALKNADSKLDLKKFDVDNDGKLDMVTFIQSGYGAEAGGKGVGDRIWSHQWELQTPFKSKSGVTAEKYHINPGLWGTSGTEIPRIGVYCHESGHFLGDIPDLYASTGAGIGPYGLMGNSWGFDGTQKYPTHMVAWSKIRVKWITPTVINTDGEYTITDLETTQKVYRINKGYDNMEYLLIENRQPKLFDKQYPQGGLYIYHIDETKCGNSVGYFPGNAGWPQTHYHVRLVQADGNFNLEKKRSKSFDKGDAFHAGGVKEVSDASPSEITSYNLINCEGTSGNRIYDISASGNTMTFKYEGKGRTKPAGCPKVGARKNACAARNSVLKLVGIDFGEAGQAAQAIPIAAGAVAAILVGVAAVVVVRKRRRFIAMENFNGAVVTNGPPTNTIPVAGQTQVQAWGPR